MGDSASWMCIRQIRSNCMMFIMSIWTKIYEECLLGLVEFIPLRIKAVLKCSAIVLFWLLATNFSQIISQFLVYCIHFKVTFRPPQVWLDLLKPTLKQIRRKYLFLHRRH